MRWEMRQAAASHFRESPTTPASVLIQRDRRDHNCADSMLALSVVHELLDRRVER